MITSSVISLLGKYLPKGILDLSRNSSKVEAKKETENPARRGVKSEKPSYEVC